MLSSFSVISITPPLKLRTSFKMFATIFLFLKAEYLLRTLPNIPVTVFAKSSAGLSKMPASDASTELVML